MDARRISIKTLECCQEEMRNVRRQESQEMLPYLTKIKAER